MIEHKKFGATGVKPPYIKTEVHIVAAISCCRNHAKGHALNLIYNFFLQKPSFMTEKQHNLIHLGLPLHDQYLRLGQPTAKQNRN
jgi:hypothetical protein